MPTTHPDTQTLPAPTDTPIRAAASPLAWSAAALGVLLVWKLLTPAPALALSMDMSASSDGMGMMTTIAGTREPLYVVDDRTETLFVYEIEQQTLELVARESLPELFDQYRARTLGAP